jgi:hypothetical protein
LSRKGVPFRDALLYWIAARSQLTAVCIVLAQVNLQLGSQQSAENVEQFTRIAACKAAASNVPVAPEREVSKIQETSQ